jgi:hypothetical protein
MNLIVVYRIGLYLPKQLSRIPKAKVAHFEEALKHQGCAAKTNL